MPHTTTLPRIHYTLTGDRGSPVLLVMGFGMAGRVWRPQLDALADQHRCCTFDHPGLGDSDPGRRTPTMRTFADHAARLLDALSWDAAHVVGVSMGGMIAQELALRHPDRVQSLGLIVTHGGGPGSRIPTAEGIRRFAGVQQANDGEGRATALQGLLYTPEFLATVEADVLAQRMADQLGDPAPSATRLAQLCAVASHRTEGRLHQISVPTLLVRAGRDLLIRPTHTDRLANRIPHARVVRFDEAGHGVTFQEAAGVNTAILEHLAAADIGAQVAPMETMEAS